MNDKVYIIIPSTKGIEEDFSNEFLEKNMKNPNVHFLISESGIGIFAIKYLMKRKYQNVTVYHIGESPKIKTKYKTKGNFSSYIEIDETLMYGEHN